MKIVKEGKWELAITCTGCKSDLVAEADDVCYTNYEEDNNFYVECPVCGTRHIFKKGMSELPPKIVNSAFAKKRG